jgi:hypothetical protein
MQETGTLNISQLRSVESDHLADVGRIFKEGTDPVLFGLVMNGNPRVPIVPIDGFL